MFPPRAMGYAFGADQMDQNGRRVRPNRLNEVALEKRTQEEKDLADYMDRQVGADVEEQHNFDAEFLASSPDSGGAASGSESGSAGGGRRSVRGSLRHIDPQATYPPPGFSSLAFGGDGSSPSSPVEAPRGSLYVPGSAGHSRKATEQMTIFNAFDRLRGSQLGQAGPFRVLPPTGSTRTSTLLPAGLPVGSRRPIPFRSSTSAFSPPLGPRPAGPGAFREEDRKPDYSTSDVVFHDGSEEEESLKPIGLEAVPAAVPSLPPTTAAAAAAEAAAAPVYPAAPEHPAAGAPSSVPFYRPHLPRLPSFLNQDATLTLSGSQTESFRLASIQDSAVRTALDPANLNVTLKQLDSLDDAQVAEYIKNIRPDHLELLIRRSIERNELDATKELSWHQITLEQNGVKVLNNVSGFIRPGQMIGILGGPDAGSTHLLSVLADRKVHGDLSGRILYDSRLVDRSLSRRVGFVIKDDFHIGNMTVYETLFFSARLRLPNKLSDRIVRLRVLMAMKLLGLSHVANTVVGDAALRGISGGEKRRVSFGIEMVAGHNIILADLPTNGLDSASAYDLIRTMRFSCRGGLAMLTSLVQPSPQLFSLLHRVIILSKGAVIFFGPTTHVVEHFEALGFICPQGKSPPQFLEELSAAPEKFWRSTRNDLGRLVNQAQQLFLEGLGHDQQQHQPQDENKPVQPGDTNSDQQHGLNGHTSNGHSNGTNGFSNGTNGLNGTKSVSNDDDDALAAIGDPVRIDSWRLCVYGYELSIFKWGVAMVLSNIQSEFVQHILATPANANDPASIIARTDGENSSTWAGWFNQQALRVNPIARWWKAKYNSSLYTQSWFCTKRQFVLTYRNVGLWLNTWTTTAIMGILLGSLYYMLPFDANGVRNQVGLWFFVMSYLGFNAVQLVPVLQGQRQVFYTQIDSAYYHPAIYVISFWLTQLPIVLVETFFLLTPVWGLSGLLGGVFRGEYWFAFLMLYLNSLTSRTFMMLLFALSPNEVYADVLNTVTNILFTKLCGYFIPANSIPAGWYWVYVISYFTYTLNGLSVNSIAPLTNPACTANTPTCFADGTYALRELYDIDGTQSKWGNIVDIVWFVIAFFGATIVLMSITKWTEADSPETPNWGFKSEQTNHKTIEQSEEKEKEYDANRQKDPRPHAAVSANNPVADSDPTVAVIAIPLQASDGNSFFKVSSPAYLEFKDMTYSVTVEKEGGGTTERVLLKNVFGYAKAGELTALMGASGAGKSTLLDVLAGKKTGGKITGQLLVNGRTKDRSFSRIAGYVEQFDSHNAFSTIYETIYFSARLRLAQNTSEEELKARVEEVMRLLGISHLSSALIGAPGHGGVSPEVRKKCTIAVELVMSPSLLFLDEPTTGLDSAGAYAVMSTVQHLCHSTGMAVICTIHQPSIELFEMFDNILIMKAGGEVSFFGACHDVPRYFESLHLGTFKPGQNPADFALDGIRTAVNSGKNTRGEDINLAQSFLDSEGGRRVTEAINNGIMPEEAKRSYVPPDYDLTHASLWTQLKVLTERFFYSFVRDKPVFWIRVVLTLFFAFVVGTVFLQLGLDQTSAELTVSAIFVTLIFVMFTANAFLPEVFTARPLYFRETQSDMYSPLAFFLARYAADVMWVIAENLVLAIMIWNLCNFNFGRSDHGSFGWFFLILVTVRWTSIVFTHWIASVISSPNFANAFQAFVFNIFMLFTGFLIRGPTIPDWWVWLYDLSFLKYAMHFIVAEEVNGLDYSCPVEPCNYHTGEDLLSAYGFESSAGWEAGNILIVWGFLLFFLINGFLALRFINHIKR